MKNKTLTVIGKRIKTVREALGMTGKDFARSINIAAPYLSQIERGNKNNPGVSLFYKIARVHNVSLDYLVCGIGDMFITAAHQHSNSQREYVDKIETLDDLYWFLENSTFFRNIVMGYAFKLHLENEDIIKKSLNNRKKQHENKESLNESENKQTTKQGPYE
ncbi:MAG: helix-turn-helix transcriptional regulator [Candidatus Aminicenantes bacterium]|jgi:transcriptional regulator with XRE-family HTH domain